MGNAITANVNLDHEVYNRQHAIEAGTNLLGKVIIQVQSTLKPCDLTLEVNGKEKTSAFEDGKTIHDKHSFFRADVELHKQGGKMIEPNTYVFPFSIPLPKSLPASRKYGDEKGSFRIEYNLKLKTQASGKFPNKRSFDVTSSARDGESVPCLLQPKPVIPEALGMEGKGQLFLGAHVKDTNVLRGGDLQVSLACRNESTLRIDRAVVTLEEEYYYNTKSVGGFGESKIFENDDIKRLPGIRVVGIHSSEVETKTIDEETIARRMFKDLKSKSNVITLRVPETSKESYSGLLLQVSHYLKFSLVTKTDEDTYPSIRIPIQIGSERPVVKESGLPMESDHVSEKARIRFPLAKADPDSIVLGKHAGALDNDESFNIPIPLPDNAKPSITILREELAASINDFDFISDKLKDLDWAIFFASLSPDDFGNIIALVASEFAQPRIAAILAQNYGGDFTCAHCAAAIRNVAPVFRSNMVEGLLAFCSDLSENNHMIRGQLSDFEQIIVALHALNEDDAPEDDDYLKEKSTSSRRGTMEEIPELTVPTDILIGGEDDDDSVGKPPSDLSLETFLKESEKKMFSKPVAAAGEAQARKMQTGIQPRRIDVLLGVADHPQTFKLVNAIKEAVDKGDFLEFCPPVYRIVMKQFSPNQRFLIAPLKENPRFLREATKLELIEHIGHIFDKFQQAKDYDKNGNQPMDNWNEPGTKPGKKSWQEALEKGQSEWELAVTIHTYTSAMDERIGYDVAKHGPTMMDICFFKPKHPGNAVLVKSIRQVLQNDPEANWSPPIYRAVKKGLVGRRMFISVGDRAWREANQVERRENIEKYFDLEKKRLKKEKRQTENGERTPPRRSVQSPTDEKEGSSHRRDNSASAHRRLNREGSSHRRLEDKEESTNRRGDGSESAGSGRKNVKRQSQTETASPMSPIAIKRKSSKEVSSGNPMSPLAVKRKSSKEVNAADPMSPRLMSRRTMMKDGKKPSSKSAPGKDAEVTGGSERLSRRSLLKNMDGSGHARRSRSAGKYGGTDTPSSPSPLDREKAKPRRSASSGKLKVSRDNVKATTPGGPIRRPSKVVRDETSPIPIKSIEVVGNDSNGGLEFSGNDSRGEMALKDDSEEKTAERPGLFRRLSRNNSIRDLVQRKLKHPRDMDICYGSKSHPGTIALTEAVIKAMHKFSGKGWGPPVYKAIRNDLQGRRFFIRPDRNSPWREASPEERVEFTAELFELKRRERKG